MKPTNCNQCIHRDVCRGLDDDPEACIDFESIPTLADAWASVVLLAAAIGMVVCAAIRVFGM